MKQFSLNVVSTAGRLQEVLGSICTEANILLNLFFSSLYKRLLTTLQILYNLGKTRWIASGSISGVRVTNGDQAILRTVFSTSCSYIVKYRKIYLNFD